MGQLLNLKKQPFLQTNWIQTMKAECFHTFHCEYKHRCMYLSKQASGLTEDSALPHLSLQDIFMHGWTHSSDILALKMTEIINHFQVIR